MYKLWSDLTNTLAFVEMDKEDRKFKNDEVILSHERASLKNHKSGNGVRAIFFICTFLDVQFYM